MSRSAQVAAGGLLRALQRVPGKAPSEAQPFRQQGRGCRVHDPFNHLAARASASPSSGCLALHGHMMSHSKQQRSQWRLHWPEGFPFHEILSLRYPPVTTSIVTSLLLLVEWPSACLERTPGRLGKVWLCPCCCGRRRWVRRGFNGAQGWPLLGCSTCGLNKEPAVVRLRRQQRVRHRTSSLPLVNLELRDKAHCCTIRLQVLSLHQRLQGTCACVQRCRGRRTCMQRCLWSMAHIESFNLAAFCACAPLPAAVAAHAQLCSPDALACQQG